MNPVLQRQLELAAEAAFNGDPATYQSALARLRTLDRTNEVAETDLAFLEAAVRTRTGDLAGARQAALAVARRGDGLLSELKTRLMRCPESGDAAFREFVDGLGAKPDAAPGPAPRAALRRMLVAIAVLLLASVAGAAGWWWTHRRPQLAFDDSLQSIGLVVVRGWFELDDKTLRSRPIAASTGIVVSADGLILTDRYVVEGDVIREDIPGCVRWDLAFILPKLSTEAIEVEVVPGSSRRAIDLAMLRPVKPTTLPPPVPFGESPEIGDAVLVVGFPKAELALWDVLRPKLTEAQLANLRKELGTGPAELGRWFTVDQLANILSDGRVSDRPRIENRRYLASDALGELAHTGGVLLDPSGRVVAVNAGARRGSPNPRRAVAVSELGSEYSDLRGVEWPSASE